MSTPPQNQSIVTKQRSNTGSKNLLKPALLFLLIQQEFFNIGRNEIHFRQRTPLLSSQRLKSTPWFFIVTFSPRTLCELHPPHSLSAASPFGRVASLQLSMVLGCVALLLSYSSPLPHGESPPLSGVFPRQWVGRSLGLSLK